MKCWAFVALLLCFSLLVSALPLHPRLPHDLIKPRHHVFDRRSNPGNDGRVTPTHEDDPNVPVPGKTGVYYDPKHNVVYAYYGDSLHEHAVHIMINHQLSPENRLPMELASVEEHRNNRVEALRNIATQMKKARDEKPLAMVKQPDGSKKSVLYVSEKESRALFFSPQTLWFMSNEICLDDEGGLLSKARALMDAHKHSKIATRPNLGFRLKPKPDMSLGISAPAKLGTSLKVDVPRKRRARKAQQQPKIVTDPYKYLAHPTYKGDVYHPIVNGGMRLRKRKQTRIIPVFVNGGVQTVKKEYKGKGANVNEKKKHDVRFKKNFLIHPEPIVPPGQAWRPAQGDGPTHAGAPLSHTDVEDRRPEKFKDHAHYMNFKKEQEEKQAKDKLEADKRRRVTQEALEARLTSKQPGALPILAPRPVSPTNFLEKMNVLRIGSDETHAGSRNKAVASSSHSRQDAHVGGSKTRGHGSASGVGGGEHVPSIKHKKSVSLAEPVPPSSPPTHHSPPVHVHDDSPPAHNTRSRKGK